MVNRYQCFVVFCFLIMSLFLSNFLPYYVFAVSPSFGHQEIRDPFADLIDIKCLKDLPKGADTNKCVHTHEGNQSTDIMAVDYFSNGRFLNATIWLASPIKESTSSASNHEETNYGMFIDADSNQKTGWQGIDYQVENSRKDGKWDRTLYELSPLGQIRILNEPKNYTAYFYQKNNNYVTLYTDLGSMGFPDKYDNVSDSSGTATVISLPPKSHENYYYNEYHEGIIEIANSLLKILSRQMVDKTMVAAVKANVMEE